MSRASWAGTVLRGTQLSCALAGASCRSRSPENAPCQGEACDRATDEGSLIGSGDGDGDGDGDGGKSGDSGRGGASGASGAAGAGEAGSGEPAGAGGSAAASGGSGAGGSTPMQAYCDFDGVTYQTGDVITVDCNRCLCSNGEMFCTDIVCEEVPSICEPDECRVGNVCYSDGGTNILAPDGCNHCTCNDGALYCWQDPSCEPGFCERPQCVLYGTCYPDGAEGIPLDGLCNTCSCDDGQLTCTDLTCERFDVPPCNEGACELDGICYPEGAMTDDSCCQCREGALQCVDEPACAAGEPIGARCDNDGDCEVGLDCRGDLAGERELCMRDCNYGCPTGTLCADGIPDFNGGLVDHICMRPCNVTADCEPFGSVCNQPAGADRRYCF